MKLIKETKILLIAILKAGEINTAQLLELSKQLSFDIDLSAMPTAELIERAKAIQQINNK